MSGKTKMLRMPDEEFIESLKRIRAYLHDCEAIMEDFLLGKRSRHHMIFTAEDDSDPVKVKIGITRAIIDMDRLINDQEPFDIAFDIAKIMSLSEEK